MGTRKCNMIDHLVPDVIRTGGLGCLVGSMYEKAHESFEEVHELISKRSQYAMSETINNMSKIISQKSLERGL